MEKNFSLGIVIGATISETLNSAFRSVENKFNSLEQKSQNIRLTKAFSNKLRMYEGSIKNLQKQREEYIKLGKSTEDIDRKLEIYKQKLKEVKIEAIKSGVSIRELRQDTDKLGKTLERVKHKMKLGKIKAEIGDMKGKLIGAVGTGLSLSAVVRPAINFESAFADIKKVVDFASREQEEAFKNTILKMSTKIPLSAGELSQIAAQGGQLGISVKDLPKFTELVAKMATAFDMLPEQAGEAFAKLSNIYNLSMEEAQELGDAINALGNNTAAKERDIINTLGRIGGIAKQFGLAKESAAALADAFIALGKPPEVAATGINALLGKLNTIDIQSSQFQQAFQKVMPIEDFKRLQQENPEKALLNFLHRLKQLDKETQKNVIAQMFGQEYADDIALLVGSIDQYAKALSIVSDKTKYQGALQKEFEARSKTTENNLRLLSNRIERLAINIGSVLLPPLNALLGKIGSGIDTITQFIEKHKILGQAIGFGIVAISGAIITITGLGLALKTAQLIALTATGTFSAIPAVLATVGKAFLFTGRAAMFLGRMIALNPVGLLIAGLAVGAYLVIAHWDKVKKFFSNLWQWIKKGFNILGSAIQKIIENSPIGMLVKGSRWIFNKFFSKEEKKESKNIINKSAINKAQKIEKTFKVDISEIKIKLDGEVKGNVDNEKLSKNIANILEEHLSKKVLEVIKAMQEDNMRRAY